MLELATVALSLLVALIGRNIWWTYALHVHARAGEHARMTAIAADVGDSQAADIPATSYYAFVTAMLVAALMGWLVPAASTVAFLAGRQRWLVHVRDALVVAGLYAAMWYTFWTDQRHKAQLTALEYVSFMYVYPPVAVALCSYRQLRAAGKSRRTSTQYAIAIPVLVGGCLLGARTLILYFSSLSDVAKTIIRVVALPLYSLLFQVVLRQLGRRVASERGEMDVLDSAAPLVAVQFFNGATSRFMQSQIQSIPLQLVTECFLLAQEVVQMHLLAHNTTPAILFLKFVRTAAEERGNVRTIRERLGFAEPTTAPSHEQLVTAVLHSSMIPITMVQEQFTVIIGYLIPILFNINLDGPHPLPTRRILASMAISYAFEGLLSDIATVAICVRSLRRDPATSCVRLWPRTSLTFKLMCITLSGLGAGMLLSLYMLTLFSCVTITDDGVDAPPLLYPCSKR